MNKYILLLSCLLAISISFEVGEESKEPTEEEDISWIVSERNRTIFYHGYHGILCSYEDKDGVWMFKRNGKECVVETESANRAYKGG